MFIKRSRLKDFSRQGLRWYNIGIMKKLIFSLAIAGLLVPALTLGAYWQAGETVSVSAVQPVTQNAYLAGSSVSVSGGVGGDLFAVGSSVSISGSVNGDIMAAGSAVNLTGIRAEDVRVAGSSVNLSGTVGGELLAAGAQVVITSDTQIAQDAYLAGSVLNFNGKVAGNLNFSGQTLVIGPNAAIDGDLNYSSPTEATIDPAAKISGKVNYTEMQGGRAGRNPVKAAFAGLFTAISIIKFLAILLAAYLIWYFRRKDAEGIVHAGLNKFGSSLLRGFIFLMVVPAASILLFFTVIGFPIGIFSLVVYAAILMLACPFTFLLAASLLIKRKVTLLWYHILLGAVVLALVGIVPIVGWLATFILYLAALGSLILTLRAKLKG